MASVYIEINCLTFLPQCPCAAGITCWMYTSQRQMTRMQMAYLPSVLSQDIGAFDTDLTTATIMAGATNHMSIIKEAIGEKVLHVSASEAQKCVFLI